ncbi:mucin-5AC [Ctenodactylus gundi]
MGVGRRRLARLWVLALALACTQHTGQAQEGSLKTSYEHYPDLSALQGHSGDPLLGVNIVPPMRTIPVVRALNPAHTGRVCSTWGDFHYKTFDGDIFRFPGLCNYVFSMHCGAAYEDFNIQLRRGQESNSTTPSRVTMKLNGLVVELSKSTVLVNGHPVQLPYSQAGVLIERSSSSLKVVAKLGLVFMWNRDDSLMLELDTKYANKTCGLCGDFNGAPGFSEFLSHNIKLNPTEFGNLQKMDGPTEQCEDPSSTLQKNCSTSFGICEEILRGQLFSSCAALVDVSSYIEACQQDLCLCEDADLRSCICHTLAEYSRQCAHAGGQPQDWRGPDLCPQACPFGMQHQECGSPCTDTCSNSQRSQNCEDHCVAGCFCPEGTVLDDIQQTGCVPVSQCACTYNGTSYAPEANYSTDCTNTCFGGRWSCQDIPCPGTCSVLGGAHFSTFDERQYTVHGDCSYVLTKPCHGSAFTVLAELRKCGLTDSETCLKSVTLSLGQGQTVVMVKASGEVFVNQIYTQLPVSAANVTAFRPSTFFIIVETNLGLQLAIQLVPTMQLFVRLAPELRGQTCGLCGNFNQNQADDFLTISGVVEGTGAAFANTWKTQAACPNVKTSFEDPCSLSVENEKFAQYWCSRLTDADGPFAPCHATVNPDTYYSNCMFDTCNCERSEDCLCASLSSYARVCAAKGVLLHGWRDGVCTKSTATCPKSMAYHEHISTCQPTCRGLSEDDITCHISFVPVDGCTCPSGTFLDEAGKCVPATSCPCYHKGSVVPNGESVHDSGAICTCIRGALTCIGGSTPTPVCDAPMVYFDCRNNTLGAAGAGCQKSCHTLDMACYSSQCVPGCVCPDGLVSDGSGGCIAEEDCPCIHNEISYRPGETIRTGCNTCTCENRMWKCTNEPCLATCAVYGDGHFLTFDGQRYSFNGACEYTLVQDHCGGNGSAQDAFRVVTENVPCGTTGTTCSKDIKIFLGSYELTLSGGKVEVIQKSTGQEPPYTIRQMGIYLVVDTDVGLMLLWDRKTSIFLRLSPEFKGRVCGLCGNFDDNAMNDLTTRSQAVVGDVLEFGNSWKFSPTCPDALVPKDPCTANPYRKSWAQRQCSIINSATFTACHTHVEPAKYYEACVSDACACDSGGDCECFCTAVAAYAQACHEAGVCVLWRTPDICPLFCDYYNPDGECEWHYQPCGAPCLRTCRNPSGHCLHDLRGLEGCYPKCPPEAPIFDEDKMQCVAECPTPTSPPPCRVHGKSYRPGSTVPSEKNCHSCICTESGVHCTYDADACVCIYDGQRFQPGAMIYHTTDGTGGCISAQCGANGTIERLISACSPSTPPPPTVFSFSTLTTVKSSTRTSGTRPSPTQSTGHTGPMSSAVSAPVSTTPRKMSETASKPPSESCREECLWSPWLDISHPGRGIDSGDFDTLENLRAHGHQLCQTPRAVECRAEDAPEVPLHILGQHVECNLDVGLTCHNKDQVSGLCDNYQIRVLCSPATSEVSSQETTSKHTSCLQEVCSWTQWIDGSYPEPDRDSGDFDTFANLRAKGYKFCESPRNVECRAQFFPNTPLAELGQQVTCNREEGLICLNKDQLPPICYNYEIRIECCHWVDNCTASHNTHMPISTAQPTSNAVNTLRKTTETLKISTASTRNSATPSVMVPEVKTHTVTSSGTKGCEPQCTWTRWFDVDSPAPGTHGGDLETYSNILSRGHRICRRPEEVTELQCRAERHPEISIRALGQVVQCDREVGLVCHNRDQQGPLGMCLNYEVRVLCCRVPEGCPTVPPATLPSTPWETVTSQTQATASTKATSSSTTWKTSSPFMTPTTTTSTRERSSTFMPKTSSTYVHTARSVSVPQTRTTFGPPVSSTTTHKTGSTPTSRSIRTTSATSTRETSSSTVHEASSTATGKPSTTSVSAPSQSHIPTSETSITPHGSRDCHPQCTWTRWFDVDSPAPGTHGGDLETYSNILSRGHRICRWPEEVTELQCRAERHPEISIRALGQVVQCDREVGLVCHNRDQQGTLGMCLNYEVRVLCCRVPEGCPTVPPATLPSTPWETVTSQTQETASTKETSSSTTWKSSSTFMTPTTTTSTRERSSTFMPKTSSTSVHTASSVSVPQTRTTFGPPVSSTTTHNTGSTPTSRSIRTTSATSTRETRSSTVHEASSTATGKPSTTSVSAPSQSHIPTSETSITPHGSRDCHPQCTWTRWFDVDSPAPGTHGGDLETYSNILSRGHRICRRPEEVTELQCRAERHPEISIRALGQVVQCDREVGLVCHNRDQQGPLGMCLNYEVRVLCCRVPEGCPTVPPATLPSTPWETVTSQTQETASTKATSSSTTWKTSSPFMTPTTTTSTRERSSTFMPKTSSTYVHTASSVSVPQTRTTFGPPVSSTTTHKTGSTPTSRSIRTTSTTSTRETSSSTVHEASSTATGKPSTTSVSAPSQSHIPTSETSITPHGSRDCHPQCTWTRWFDVDSPAPGTHGGDLETYSNILSRGHRICRWPEEVTELQCRAERHPEISIRALGQVVQCDREVGLVCHNRDQQGPLGMCLNYEVRVLCCRVPEGCPTVPPATLPSTPWETVTSQTQETASTKETSSSTTWKSSSTFMTPTTTTSTRERSSTFMPKTSSTSVHTASSVSVPQTRTTFGPPVSSTTTHKTGSTPTSRSTHTTSATSTRETSSSTVHEASSTATGKPSTTSVSAPSQSHIPTSETSITPHGSRDCHPQCTWTRWFDVDSPAPGKHGGDHETYSNILSRGHRICRRPEEVTELQCRAEHHPEISIRALGQVVQCDREVGLVCHNRDQQGPLGMCLNYEVRVLCCRVPEGCPTVPPATLPSTTWETVTSQTQETASTKATSSSTTWKTSSPFMTPTTTTSTRERSSTFMLKTSSTSVHTASSVSVPQTRTTFGPPVSSTTTHNTGSTPTSRSIRTTSATSTRETRSSTVHEASSTATGKPSTTSVSAPSQSHIPTSETSITPHGSRDCHPQCTWTRWFDVDSPAPGTHGGDLETYSNILSRGHRICRRPEEVTELQCRAERHPEISIRALGQVVQCDREVGLVCHNRDQQGPLGMCLNYEVRVLCCRVPEGCPTLPPATLPSTPWETVTSQTQETASTKGTSSSTTRKASSTSMIPTTTTSTRERSSTFMPKTSSTYVHTASSVSVPQTRTTFGPPVSSTTTHKTGSTPTSRSVRTTSTTSTRETSSSTVHEASSTATGKPSTTSVSAPSQSHIPTSETSITPHGSRDCHPQCTWTRWFDVDSPAPGTHGGDLETYSNILSRGHRICRWPEEVTELQCRAERHPEISIRALGQVVQCDREVGLVCHNRDQQGPLGMCLNYEVRVLCCRVPEGCPTVPPATLPSTPWETVTSQTQATASTKETSSSTTWKSSSTFMTPTTTTSTRERSSTFMLKTSSTSVHTASSVSVPQTRTTFGPPVSSTTTHKTGSTPTSRSVRTTSTTSTRETRSSTVHEASSTATGKPSTTSVSAPSQSHIPTSETSITPHGSRDCHPQCTWTRWFDVDSPAPGTHGGDLETYSNILSRGHRICRRPEEVTELQCRAERHPEISIRALGQVVQCDREVGLVCHNRDQQGPLGMCLNYEVRVLCCRVPEGCPTLPPATLPSTPWETVTSQTQETASTKGSSSSTTRKASSTSMIPTTTTSTRERSSTFMPKTSSTYVHTASSVSVPQTRTTFGPPVSSTTTHKTGSTPTSRSVRTTSTTSTRETSSSTVHEASSTATGKPSTTSVSAPSQSHIPTSETSITPHGSRDCHPQCTWTRWFDVDSPAPGTHGGDLETYSNILSRGHRICRRPEEVTELQCRAERHPEISIRALGQVVQCDREVGLVCHNRDQQGPLGMCLNYEVRVLCCRVPEGCPTLPPATLPSTPWETVTSQTQATASTKGTSSSTTRKASSTSMIPTTTTSTRERSSTFMPKTSSTYVHTASSVSVPQTRTTFGPPVSSTTTHKTGSTPTSRSVRTTSTTSTRETSSSTVHEASSTATGKPSTTSVSAPSQSHIPTSETSITPHGSRDCHPQCTWTRWFDVDSPAPGTHGGDLETYSNILSRGHRICRRPEEVTELQCRAERHPEISIRALGQVVQCDREVGLVCHNRDQQGPLGMCLNYEVRVLCCRVPEGCPTLPPATLPSTPWETVTSQTQETASTKGTSSSTTWKSSSPFMTPTTTTSTRERSSTFMPKTSSTSVHTASSESLPQTRTTFGLPVSSTTMHNTGSMPTSRSIRTTSTTSTWETSSSTVHEASSTATGKPSRASVSAPSQSHIPTSETSITPHGSRDCHPQCTWTRWFDVDSPAPGTYGGDLETYSNILQKGHRICLPSEEVTRLQCRAELHPELSITTLGQVVQCDRDVGLVCRNRDQQGPLGMCLNYQVRVLCCRVPDGCPQTPKGETWAMPNCTQATCQGDDVITLHPRQCPELKMPSCANGYPALKVADQDSCCQHYQCQCVCSGWGDPHYITFDGTYYTFLDECTYVLVQQIVPVFGHFRVLVDNYFCGMEDGVSCPQSIIVEYHQDRVVLTRRPVGGVMTNQIIFNGEVVSPGFQKNGIAVSRIGIKMYVTIREIGVQVMFSGLIFSVEVPFSTFANNTEGQCGTCTNNQKEECRLPGGALASSCSKMAGHWRVPNPDQPSCRGPTPAPTSAVPTTPPATCQPSAICKLILSEVFEVCHSVIPPLPFFEGCVFDHCHKTDQEVVCSGLELYASLCASQGVCIDWRGRTNNMCPFFCPADKVYQPCGPSTTPYCYGNDSISFLALPEAGPITEGCFCPESMALFSTSSQGVWGHTGNRWSAGTTTSVPYVTCAGLAVAASGPRLTTKGSRTFSSQPGQTTSVDCQESCNSSYCPKPLDCPEGSSLIVTHEEGACCPSQSCNWTACSVNGTLYKPGAVVSSSLCEKCRCEISNNPEADAFVISCETEICNTHCPVPGESWSDPGNHCVTHTCEKYQDGLMVVTIKTECPPLNCPRDQAQLSPDGCCLLCPSSVDPHQLDCTVHHRDQIIRHQGCNSTRPVRLSYCQGVCGESISKYSLEANAVEHKCQCCQELRTSQEKVTLYCANGSSRSFTYTQVEECGCLGQQCRSPGDTSYSESGELGSRENKEQSQESESRRLRV